MIATPHESAPLTPVTVLGLGPMGRALASAFLNARQPVTVWNRTPGKAGDFPTVVPWWSTRSRPRCGPER